MHSSPKNRFSPVRDTELKGFGVQVWPSGTKSYLVHTQHDGRRFSKVFGDAKTLPIAEARRRAAEEVFRRYARHLETTHPRGQSQLLSAAQSCRGSRAGKSPGSNTRMCSDGSRPCVDAVLSVPVRAGTLRDHAPGPRSTDTASWSEYREGKLFLADSKTGREDGLALQRRPNNPRSTTAPRHLGV